MLCLLQPRLADFDKSWDIIAYRDVIDRSIEITDFSEQLLLVTMLDDPLGNPQLTLPIPNRLFPLVGKRTPLLDRLDLLLHDCRPLPEFDHVSMIDPLLEP